MKEQRSNRLAPYLLTGFVACVAVQLVFWRQIGSAGPRALLMPFLLAYSQKAMVDCLIYEPAWPVTAALWLGSYAVIAIILWASLERPGRSPERIWRRAVGGWIAAELILGLVAFVLLKAGALKME